MEHLTIGAFWDALTWHTLIEVVAIIIAAIIVHPFLSATKRSYDWLSHRFAISSRKRALRRIKHLLDRYARISRARELLQTEAFHAALITSHENLVVIVLYSSAISAAEMFNLREVGAVLFCITTIFALRIQYKRAIILQFDKFREDTQSKFIALRAAVNDDTELAKLWKAYFHQSMPI
jgi:hypothetical protein